MFYWATYYPTAVVMFGHFFGPWCSMFHVSLWLCDEVLKNVLHGGNWLLQVPEWRVWPNGPLSPMFLEQEKLFNHPDVARLLPEELWNWFCLCCQLQGNGDGRHIASSICIYTMFLFLILLMYHVMIIEILPNYFGTDCCKFRYGLKMPVVEHLSTIKVAALSDQTSYIPSTSESIRVGHVMSCDLNHGCVP